jgi:hypothetical protein
MNPAFLLYTQGEANFALAFDRRLPLDDDTSK